MNYDRILIPVGVALWSVSQSKPTTFHETRLILKWRKFGKKIRISLLNKKWMFLQNRLCSWKFSITVNFDGWIGWSGHPSIIAWWPLTRSWFRFWFWWQFNGDFFDRLVSLFFFAQFDSRFYFCIFWIFRSCFIICANEDRLGSTRTAQTLGQTRLAEIYFKNGTYWIYSELPKHLDSFRWDLWRLEPHRNSKFSCH